MRSRTSFFRWRATFLIAVVLMSAAASFAQSPLRVHTQEANAIRADRANLNGMAFPGSNTASVWFEWGTSRLYGNIVGRTNVSGGNRVITLRHMLTGLNPGYVYHTRLVASNLTGVVFGADRQFTLGGTVGVWGNPNFGHTVPPNDLTNAVSVSGGGDHCVALRNDGTIAMWGGNAYGQKVIPPEVVEPIAVAAGQFHTLALLPDGTVRAWGAGTSLSTFPDSSMQGGQSIVPAGLSNVVQIAPGTTHSVALKSDGTIAAWGSAFISFSFWSPLGQAQVPAGLSNVVSIASGDFHSLALKADGTVAVWGYNTHGQGINPSGLSNVVAIACGWYNNLALKRDGTVFAWGAGTVNSGIPHYGQSIVPPGLTNVAGVAGGGFYSLAWRTDGTAIGWGIDDFGQTSVMSSLNGVIALSGGYDFSMALLSSAPNEVALRLQRIGGQVRLDWLGGMLQSAESVEGPYNDLFGEVPPLVFTPMELKRFYRVKVQP